jgi:hypothetical protein
MVGALGEERVGPYIEAFVDAARAVFQNNGFQTANDTHSYDNVNLHSWMQMHGPDRFYRYQHIEKEYSAESPAFARATGRDAGLILLDMVQGLQQAQGLPLRIGAINSAMRGCFDLVVCM